MRCGSCGELDYSIAYLTNPPQYKCDKYGCIVRIDATCKGDKNAEEQEPGKEALNELPASGEEIQAES